MYKAIKKNPRFLDLSGKQKVKLCNNEHMSHNVKNLTKM